MAWQNYLRMLEKYPMRTWMIQTGVTLGLGDVISQVVVEKKELPCIDKKRVLRFAAMGTFFVAPAVRGWYVYLDRYFGSNGSTFTAVKKMVVDQAIFAPLLVGNFMLIMGMVQRQPWCKVEERFGSDYLDILKANWMVWPVVQLMNFYFVPIEHRIIVVNATTLFWNSYLAWMCNKPCICCPMQAKGTSALYFEDCPRPRREVCPPPCPDPCDDPCKPQPPPCKPTCGKTEPPPCSKTCRKVQPPCPPPCPPCPPPPCPPPCPPCPPCPPPQIICVQPVPCEPPPCPPCPPPCPKPADPCAQPPKPICLPVCPQNNKKGKEKCTVKKPCCKPENNCTKKNPCLTQTKPVCPPPPPQPKAKQQGNKVTVEIQCGSCEEEEEEEPPPECCPPPPPCCPPPKKSRFGFLSSICGGGGDDNC